MAKKKRKTKRPNLGPKRRKVTAKDRLVGYATAYGVNGLWVLFLIVFLWLKGLL